VSARRSLRRRLLLAGAAGIALVAVLAAWLLGEAFERAAGRAFERALGNEHAVLVGLLEAMPDGSVALREPPGDARYQRPYSGAYWQVGEGPSALRSRSLWDVEVALPPARADGRREVLRAAGPSGQSLRVVRQRVRLPRANVDVIAWMAADDGPVREEVADFRALAATAVGLLSALFLGVLAVQVQVGLRPLRALSEALARVRRGDQERLEVEGLPGEIAPLAGHLNELLEHHERAMARARHAAADLAHALKTPLAVLDAAAQRPGPELAAVVREQGERMQVAVRRQLASSAGADFRARTPAAPVAATLAGMLGSVHRDRGIAIDVAVPAALRFPGSAEDLEEILGNLMDNACKWARARVSVGGAADDAGGLALWVDDDGPGLSPDEAERALGRGVRLDERVQGSGLGLAIVDDLVRAHGGQLLLERAPAGGLRARVALAPAGAAR
jgi:signal transduction histidine kinase